MDSLKGFQKRFLRSLAHSLKPVVFIGQKGFTQSLADAMDDALNHHELVKVKFVEFKEKEKKLALVEQIEKTVPCEMVGLIGHMATFFRQQSDPERRRISLPKRAKD
ncbi:MAG: YhbY family RNA-binding protein [Desulfosarcina sp.]|nr:YhbY family RNA-binding protein [Desulfosarcina sp.]MBC2743916.1 YhbY family RNA-binding protein [Desulfosarcina sp.]MBC2766825.1 YhbY family RNA-binding protein [Desulfosarcina sp.]